MDINLTLIGQMIAIHFVATHFLAAGALTFYYGRHTPHSAGMSLLAIFAWLAPVVGPACFAIFLVAKRKAVPSSQ